ncbi:hypothetical protein [Mesorhizobium delmotii]|uniref:hypothetical protein n=1 Tax=Mesorhizobium delmotii TaxID=1631247 RepID=UPI001AD80122|nr:hypothetical protein [Mesorhizobium delmotii]
MDTPDEAVDAAPRISGVDRARVRQTFEVRFTVERMCSDYLAIYRSRKEGTTNALGSQNKRAKNTAIKNTAMMTMST